MEFHYVFCAEKYRTPAGRGSKPIFRHVGDIFATDWATSTQHCQFADMLLEELRSGSKSVPWGSRSHVEIRQSLDVVFYTIKNKTYGLMRSDFVDIFSRCVKKFEAFELARMIEDI